MESVVSLFFLLFLFLFYFILRSYIIIKRVLLTYSLSAYINKLFEEIFLWKNEKDTNFFIKYFIK